MSTTCEKCKSNITFSTSEFVDNDNTAVCNPCYQKLILDLIEENQMLRLDLKKLSDAMNVGSNKVDLKSRRRSL